MNENLRDAERWLDEPYLHGSLPVRGNMWTSNRLTVKTVPAEPVLHDYLVVVTATYHVSGCKSEDEARDATYGVKADTCDVEVVKL